MAYQEMYVFGLKITDANSASEWAARSVENYIATALAETFDELKEVPLDKTYNFLMRQKLY